MLEILEGGTYVASKTRSGQSDKGDWELVVVKDDRGKCPINLWVVNRPSGVATNGKFTVNKITGLRNGWRHYEMNGRDRWEPKIDVDAIITPIGSDFEDLPDMMDDDPFADIPEEDQLPL